MFAIEDCLKPITETYGQFDFVVGHFILHRCPDEAAIQIFFRNAINLLKPNGKIFIGMVPYVANNPKDRDIIADLGGFQHRLAAEVNGKDPVFVTAPAYRPGATESGRPYTREYMFTFEEYAWSREKVIKNMEKEGFVNINSVPEAFPSDIQAIEQHQIKSLEEPYILVGATKPSLE